MPKLAAPWIFCTGMPRSGSTWSYNVCRLAAEYALASGDVVCGYVGGESDASGTLNAMEHSAPNRIVKTHDFIPEVVELIEAGKAISIYTHRHPLNAVVSITEFFGQDFDAAVATVKRSLVLADRLRSAPHSYFIPYNAIMERPLAAADAVVAATGLALDRRGLHAIAHSVSLASMKEFSDALRDTFRDRLAETNGLRHDDTTLLHADHIQSDGHRDYQTALTKAQIAAGTIAFEPWLGAGWLAPL